MANKQIVKDLYDACNERDVEHFLAALHPEVEWKLAVWLGGDVRRGRESLRDYMRMLDEHAAHWRLKEVVELANRAISRHEGEATSMDRSTRVGGTGFRLLSFEGGLITRAVPYTYRTHVLDALGLTRPERQGLLTVQDDDDERLYHFGIGQGGHDDVGKLR